MFIKTCQAGKILASHRPSFLQKKPYPLWKNLLKAVFPPIVTLALLLLVIKLPIWKVEKIDVSFQNIDTVLVPPISSKINSALKGVNFWFIKKNNLVENLSNEFSQISEVEISKRLPNKVSVTILGRRGFLKLSGFNDKLIDQSGYVFEASYAAVLPEYVASTPSLTESSLGHLSKEDCALVAVLSENISVIDISSIDAKTGFLRTANIDVFLDLSRPVPEQLTKISQIISQTSIENKPIHSIDLRFGAPLIK